jgi:hypothetical protein
MLSRLLSRTARPIAIAAEESSPAADRLKLLVGPIRERPLFSCKVWLQADILSAAQLKNYTFNWVLGEGRPQTAATNCIGIASLEEVEELLQLSLFELERRCKMECLLGNARSKCDQRLAVGRVREMAVGLLEARREKAMKLLLRFMGFNARSYLRQVRRAWNIWVISHLSTRIDRTEQMIVAESAQGSRANRTLLHSCFASWKRLTSSSDHFRLGV